MQVFVPFISDVRVGNSLTAGPEPAVETGEEAAAHSHLATTSAAITSHHHHHHAVFLDRPSRTGGSLSSSTGGGGAGSGAQAMAAAGSGGATGGGGEKLTPPSSPNISKYAFEMGGGGGERSRSESSNSKSFSGGGGNSSHAADSDLMELQLDYWLNEKMAALMRTDNGGGGGDGSALQHRRSESDSKPRKPLDPKSSIRTTFRSLTITHLAGGGGPVNSSSSNCGSEHCFAMTYVSKEKRLGKAVLKIGKKKVS
jgi:hypothetical protein